MDRQTPAAISTLVYLSGMAFQIHAHMLRHACGYALANAGHNTRPVQAWLGHRIVRAPGTPRRR